MSPAKYGQHFLIDKDVLDKIVAAIDPTPIDHILEIGPGKGVLTDRLIRACQFLTAIEIDSDMIEILNEKYGEPPNFDLVYHDFLKYDLDDLPEPMHKVAGNIPYKITSPILQKLSDWEGWSEATLMVQREVGDRLCASVGTGDYGAITVGVSLTCETEKLFDISNECFKPPPKVQSVLLKLKRREAPLTEHIQPTKQVVQAAFQQRRKTIENSLSHGLNMDKAKVRKVIEDLGLSPMYRAENLTVENFISLATNLPN